MPTVEATVVGAGPNGLAAAITLAQAGISVRVHEAAGAVGGSARTEDLTLSGFHHDVCAAVHPLGAGSPFLRTLPLEEHGLRWIDPPIAMAHPLDDGPPITLRRSLRATADSLGLDAARYRALVGPFVQHWDALARDALRPVTATIPHHPLLLARFGLRGALPVAVLAATMRGSRGPAMLAGLAAHAIAPVTSPSTGGIATLFAVAGHSIGWPVVAGGTQMLADALAAHLRSLGGEIVTDSPVRSLRQLPSSRATLLDLAPWNIPMIAGDALPPGYRRRLQHVHHGPAAFKVDYALSAPIPWRDDACRSAGTVHIGGTYAEIAEALHSVSAGRAPERPFLITAQQSLFDAARAPGGQHTLWAYGHVPCGWSGDLTERIEMQIERFAPGFRDVVLHRTVAGPAAQEQRNPNLVGGDIGAGSFRGHRAFVRPVLRPFPHATPNPSLFLCGAATPPGPGVHGMCGYYGAALALRRVFGLRAAPLME